MKIVWQYQSGPATSLIELTDGTKIASSTYHSWIFENMKTAEDNTPCFALSISQTTYPKEGVPARPGRSYVEKFIGKEDGEFHWKFVVFSLPPYSCHCHVLKNGTSSTLSAAQKDVIDVYIRFRSGLPAYKPDISHTVSKKYRVKHVLP